ncbi:hypothetical protein BD309DRAFT_970954 [Dichomitus squalens]|nr:hypothetical protein BD309DRAFT_970954 [Dichomitus squalens]
MHLGELPPRLRVGLELPLSTTPLSCLWVARCDVDGYCSAELASAEPRSWSWSMVSVALQQSLALVFFALTSPRQHAQPLRAPSWVVCSQGRRGSKRVAKSMWRRHQIHARTRIYRDAVQRSVSKDPRHLRS